MRVNARNIRIRETDDSGTGIRIRPATPKLNLINVKKRGKSKPAAMDIEAIQNRVLAMASMHGNPNMQLKSGPDLTGSPQ